MNRVLARLSRLLGGGSAAAFLLTALFCYEAALVTLLLWPGGQDPLGRFADDFRLWCFGVDAVTGGARWSTTAMVLAEPAGLGTVVLVLFLAPLRERLRDPLSLALPMASALLLCLAGGAAALVVGVPRAVPALLPFPGEALRTGVPFAPLALVDHEGHALDDGSLRGRVVVVTAVYASCGQTCPRLLAQAKRTAAALTERERAEITFVAVTLDPTRDTAEVLTALAAAQGLAAPQFRFATGAPAVVEATLDRLGVERRRDPSTGIIDHGNLFVVVDRAGRVAYRLTLGEQQEAWLADALRGLVSEEAPAS